MKDGRAFSAVCAINFFEAFFTIKQDIRIGSKDEVFFMDAPKTPVVAGKLFSVS